MPKVGISSGIDLSEGAQGGITLTPELKPGVDFIFDIRCHGNNDPITVWEKFEIYNSSKVKLSRTLTYDWTNHLMKVKLNNPDDWDPNGYWVRYNRSSRGIETQYPFRYKNADQWNIADLIPFGSYEDKIPYWRIFSDETPPWEASRIGPWYEPHGIYKLMCTIGLYEGLDCNAKNQRGRGFFRAIKDVGNTVYRINQIESSVPYFVRYGIYETLFRTAFWVNCIYCYHEILGTTGPNLDCEFHSLDEDGIRDGSLDMILQPGTNDQLVPDTFESSAWKSANYIDGTTFTKYKLEILDHNEYVPGAGAGYSGTECGLSNDFYLYFKYQV